MGRARLLRLFWIAAAATLVVAAAVALAAVVGGRFDETDGQILASLGTLLLAGAVATAGGSLVDAFRSRVLGPLLVASAPLAAAVGLAAIWDGFDTGALNRAAGSAYVLLATGLVVGTARALAGERPRLRRLFVATAACSAVAAGLSVGGIAAAPVESGFGKLLAAAWILTALAYLLLPVARRLDSGPAGAPPRPVDLAVGVETGGVRVRLASAATELRRETVVVVLEGGAQAGPATLAAGDAVVAPAGTELTLAPEGRALLVGR